MEAKLGRENSILMGPPPLPLLAVFGIVVFYLYLSDSYERALFSLKVFFVLFPIFLFFLLRSGSTETGGGGGFKIPSLRMSPVENSGGGGGGRVALVLVLVLLLISWHPSLKSKWAIPSSS